MTADEAFGMGDAVEFQFHRISLSSNTMRKDGFSKSRP
jgi:hypothetical protein